jgi:hypothetical protein
VQANLGYPGKLDKTCDRQQGRSSAREHRRTWR